MLYSYSEIIGCNIVCIVNCIIDTLHNINFWSRSIYYYFCSLNLFIVLLPNRYQRMYVMMISNSCDKNNGTCINIHGGYECGCNDGFVLVENNTCIG